MQESIKQILSVVGDEVATVGVERSFLDGNSQGGATAIHILFHGGLKLGALIGICSWLLSWLGIEILAKNSQVPNSSCTFVCSYGRTGTRYFTDSDGLVFGV